MGVAEAKGHNFALKDLAGVGAKGVLRLVLYLDGYLPKSRLHMQRGEEPDPVESLENVITVGQRVDILDGGVNQQVAVDAKTPSPVLLSYH